MLGHNNPDDRITLAFPSTFENNQYDWIDNVYFLKPAWTQAPPPPDKDALFNWRSQLTAANNKQVWVDVGELFRQLRNRLRYSKWAIEQQQQTTLS